MSPKSARPAETSANGSPAMQWFLIAVLLVAIFSVSAAARFPNLGRPLAEHHEWLTATVLRNLDIWWQEGAIHDRFQPIFSYTLPADKWINDQASEHFDSKGNYYYTSYGPFAYIAPYAVFKAIGQRPSPFRLELFNMVFHFICSVFIFLILYEVLRPKRAIEFAAPLLGFVFYVFAPETLWFQSNVYMSDTFVQVFFIVGIWLFFRFSRHPGSKWLYPILIGVDVFLMTWTEWIGIFFAAVVGIYALANWRKPPMRRLFVAVAAGAALAVVLFFAQYSLISGVGGLIKASVEKYKLRSGVTGTSVLRWDDPESWIRIGTHYKGGYAPFLVLAVSLGLATYAMLFVEPARESRPLGARAKTALQFAFLPVLLHHIVFFDFTANHDFSVLKTAVPLALVLAFLFEEIRRGVEQVDPKNLTVAVTVFFLVATGFAAARGLHDYRNQEIMFRLGSYKLIGERIKREAKPDEVVFIKRTVPWFNINPQIVYYAGRNITMWSTEADADALLRKTGSRDAFVVVINMNGSASIERYGLRAP